MCLINEMGIDLQRRSGQYINDTITLHLRTFCIRWVAVAKQACQFSHAMQILDH